VGGATLSAAAWCAAQLCVPLEEFLGNYATDAQMWIREAASEDENGGLRDLLATFDYATPEEEEQARRNLALLDYGKRTRWIAAKLGKLTQIWPRPGGEPSANRLYRDEAGDTWAYRAAPQELMLCSAAQAVDLMLEGRYPKPL